jgi:hypothetical protein
MFMLIYLPPGFALLANVSFYALSLQAAYKRKTLCLKF